MRDTNLKRARPKHHSASEWRELVEEWKKSGQSQEEFAAVRGVTVKTLRWWDTTFRTGRDLAPTLKKTTVKGLAVKASAKAPRMVALRVDPTPPQDARWELQTAHGHFLRGHDALGPDLITALLDALLRASRPR